MSHIPADHVSAAKKKDIACVNITGSIINVGVTNPVSQHFS